MIAEIKFEVNGVKHEIEPCAIANSSLLEHILLYLYSKDGRHIGWGYIAFPPDKADKKISTDWLRDDPDLPKEIVSNFREAFGCYLSGFYTASVVMSRRLLEQVLISKGATPNQRISDMIKELVRCGIIDEMLKDLCDDIKYFGNIGAHVKEEEAEKSDAETALNFCDFLITWLFGKVDEMPKKRGNKVLE